jgi:hypothetical protein
VGAALSAWEKLEWQISRVFGILCETQTTAAQRAYGSAASHGARNDMLREAGEVYFHRHPAHKETFRQLLEEFGKLAGRRNDIAHGCVVRRANVGSGHGHWLEPLDYNSRKTNAINLGARKYSYTHIQIDAFGSAFSDCLRRWILLTRALLVPKA